MKKKKIKICFLTLGLLLTPFDTLALNKTETIYSNLEYDGSLKNSVISNHLSFIGDKEIEDETELKDILNINGEEKYTLKENRLTWENSGNDIFYRGSLEKTQPIEVEIEYYIDGKKEKIENVIGKEGHIRIIYKLKNNQKNKMNINGQTETIYTPFMTTLGTIIKGKDTKNIAVENGKVIDTGSRTIVVAFASPGLYESTKIEELKNLNKIVIEFDTKSFELGTAYIVSTPKLLEKKDLSIFKKFDALESNVNMLKTNMNLLDKGAKELEKGALQLQTGSATLSDSLLQAVTSIGELKIGSINLNQGLAQVKKTLANTKVELEKNSTEELKELKKANNYTINSLIASTGKTFEELTAIYTGNNLNSYTGTDTTLLNVKNTYELAGLLNKNNQAIDTSLKMADEMSTKIDSMLHSLTEILNSLETGSSQLANGLTQLETGIQKIYAGSKDLKIGSQKLSEGSITLSNGTTTFKTEGIDKLGSYAHTFKTYSSRAEALVNLSRKYAGFASNNSDETLFVYQVKSLK